MAGVARPGKGRPPAIRSGSGSRHSLPRRSKTMLKRSDDNDKSLSDALNGLVGTIETDLAPFGLGLITPPAKKESVDDSDTTSYKPLRFARQIPQVAPPVPQRAEQMANAAAGQASEFLPFEFPGGGAGGIPTEIQGEIPSYFSGYAGPVIAGEPPFAVPNGQPRVPAGFSGIPSQMMGELQTGEQGLPVGQQQAGTVGGAVGQVGEQLQNAVQDTPAGGAGFPFGNIVGLPGQFLGGGGLPFSEIEGLTGSLGSTVGQTIPGGFSGTLGGLTGTVGGLTGSLPVVGGMLPGIPNLFGAFEGGPPNGEQESAGESTSSEAPQSETSVTSSSAASASETTTLPSTSTFSTDASEATSTSVSSTDSSMSASASSASDAEPTFAVNVAPDPAAAARSHSLPTGSHTLPLPTPNQIAAPGAPSPQAPRPPIINVEAPSPTPSGTESGTESSSSYLGDQSTSSTESSSSTTDSSTSSAMPTSTSSSAAAEPTTTSTVDPVERRMLLSRIMRYFRRDDAPLPKGFAAPTGPIPNDTPPLLKSTVKYPGPAGKVKKDQAPAPADADATTTVTVTATSESQTESSSSTEESTSADSSETSSSESTVSLAESTSIASA